VAARNSYSIVFVARDLRLKRPTHKDATALEPSIAPPADNAITGAAI